MMIMSNAKKESQFLKNLILGLSGNLALAGNPADASPAPAAPAASQDAEDPPPLPTRSALSRSNSQEILASGAENES